jgi:hypothetical protein
MVMIWRREKHPFDKNKHPLSDILLSAILEERDTQVNGLKWRPIHATKMLATLIPDMISCWIVAEIHK